jgi:hypothetical protein
VAIIARVSAPKSTSVPRGDHVAATGSPSERAAMTSGIHSASCARSSLNRIPSNSGHACSASKRRRRKSTFSAPCTKLMWGTDRMNARGSDTFPRSTRYAQSCRETSNCSMIFTALRVSIVPSSRSAV